MAIFRMPDPLPLKGPSSASPKLKMVGNMIELKNPTARMLHIAVWPLKSIEAVTNAPATIAQRASRLSGPETLQKSCAKKAPEHGATPEERDKACRSLGGEAGNLGQAKIVHQKASDRNLGPHIGENANCAEEEIGMFPDGVLPHISGAAGRIFNFWQPGNADQHCQ